MLLKRGVLIIDNNSIIINGVIKVKLIERKRNEMPPRSKINASEVEVLDRQDHYVNTNVEDVLAEIYSKLGIGGGPGTLKVFTKCVSEYPADNYTFFQDDNLFVTRDNPNSSSVVYNGAVEIINFMTLGTGGPKTITCSTHTIHKYGAIKTRVRFNSVGNVMRLRLNKNDDTYYQLEISSSGTNLKSYVDGVAGPVIWSEAGNPAILSNLYEYLFFYSSGYLFYYFNGGLKKFGFANNDEPGFKAGKMEISLYFPDGTSRQIDCSFIEMGEIPEALYL